MKKLREGSRIALFFSLGFALSGPPSKALTWLVFGLALVYSVLAEVELSK